MATTSAWTGWVETATDRETEGTSSAFTGWVEATTDATPESEWFVSVGSLWVPAYVSSLS